MTESEAFLCQAHHDLNAFLVLETAFSADPTETPECQPLHFLQMATEKLGKAAFLARGRFPTRGKWYHDDQYWRDVWGMLQSPALAAALGKDMSGLDQLLSRCDSVRQRVSQFHPVVADQAGGAGERYDDPNVEYPWQAPPGDWHAPGEEPFGLLTAGSAARPSSDVADFIRLIVALLRHFGAVFPAPPPAP